MFNRFSISLKMQLTREIGQEVTYGCILAKSKDGEDYSSWSCWSCTLPKFLVGKITKENLGTLK